MKKYYRVLINAEPELYEAWKKHVTLIYGIKPSGGHAGITAKNSEVFSEAIKGMMRYEKGDTGKAV